MESTVLLTDGFVLLTGEIGCGKTTLIESFISNLPNDVVVVRITQTQLSAVAFLQAVLAELGFEPFQMKKVELLFRLRTFLRERAADGKRVLLIIDEAQNLSPKVLEEVRLLSGLEVGNTVLHIILAGQPELADKLDAPGLEQLAQRIRLRFHLSALTEQETKAYVRHRLEVAGSNDHDIFSEDALDLIFRYTGGIPRLINTLCDTALLSAFSRDESTISGDTVELAAGELQWLPYSHRNNEPDGNRAHGPNSAQKLEAPLAKLDAVLEELRNSAYAQHPTERIRLPLALARLDVLRRGRLVSSLDLHKGSIVIGRAADVELRIDSSYMSRRHARIATSEKTSILEDLGSTNGTRVRGRSIDVGALSDGDEISLGDHTVVYTDLRGTGRPTPPGFVGSHDAPNAKSPPPTRDSEPRRWQRRDMRKKPWRN